MQQPQNWRRPGPGFGAKEYETIMANMGQNTSTEMANMGQYTKRSSRTGSDTSGQSSSEKGYGARARDVDIKGGIGRTRGVKRERNQGNKRK